MLAQNGNARTVLDTAGDEEMSVQSQSPSPSNLDRITTPIDVLKDVFKEEAAPSLESKGEAPAGQAEAAMPWRRRFAPPSAIFTEHNNGGSPRK